MIHGQNNDKDIEHLEAEVCELYQKGGEKKEKGNDGEGGGNQLSREGGVPVQSHHTSLCQIFWKPIRDPGFEQSSSASPPPSPSSYKSAEAPQLRRPQVGNRGLKPAADIAFKVDAT